MEIWRSGPSGAKVTKSGWVEKRSGSSLRLSADHFSRAAMVSRLWGRLRSSSSICSGWPSRRAPRRRASVAFPTPSGPEKSRVCARRSCAIMRSSARVTWGLPQKLSNIRADDAPDLALDGVDIGAPVDQLDALRLARGQRVVGMVNLAMEFDGLVVHAGFAVRLRQIAGAGARQAGFSVDVHQQGERGLEAAAGDAFEGEDGIHAEVAAAALVNQRGIRETVGEDDLAAVQRGCDPLVHILRPRGEIEQHFGGGAEFLVGGIEQDAADLHADRGAAGLGGFQHSPAQAAQAGVQAVHLGGLAGTIHALECDESTASRHGNLPL